MTRRTSNCLFCIFPEKGGLALKQAKKVSLLLLDRHGDGVMGRSTPSTRLVCESPHAIDATPACAEENHTER